MSSEPSPSLLPPEPEHVQEFLKPSLTSIHDFQPRSQLGTIPRFRAFHEGFGVIKYRPEIDGLRALAVVPVVFFHTGIKGFSGGFVGVDIFFVISGYLITSILISELATGSFSFAKFYERRARRILPALFLVMLTCLPFAYAWMLPKDLKIFSQSLVAVNLFSSNLLFYLTSNYFDIANELKPLLHTWSLAVEEQYYVIFPFFILLTARMRPGKILSILFLISTLSLVASQVLTRTNPALSFYLLPTRGWEILVGSMIAFAMFHRPESSRGNESESSSWPEIFSLLGLAMIVCAIVFFNSKTKLPGLLSLLPTVGAALNIAFSTSRTMTGRFLAWSPFVNLGLISYSTYLWHQPILAFARYRSVAHLSTTELTLLALSSFLMGYLSYKFVETPFRKKQTIPTRQFVKYAATLSIFLIAAGLSGHFTRGYPIRFDRLPQAKSPLAIDMPTSENGWCFYSADTEPSLKKVYDCRLGEKSSSRNGLLFGDSFAGQYEPFWDTVGKKFNFGLTSITSNWCFPSLGTSYSGPVSSRASQQCQLNRAYLKAHISQYDFVIFGGDWPSVYADGDLDAFISTVDWAVAQGKFVLVMSAPPHYDANVGSVYRRGFIFGETLKEGQLTKNTDLSTAQANAMVHQRLKGKSGVEWIDRGALFLAHQKPSDLDENAVPFSFDGAHISIQGSISAAKGFIMTEQARKLGTILTGQPAQGESGK